MNNEIKIFESPEFGRIRTVTDERGEPWFCLTDVCKVLGLKQRHVRERLDDGVVSTDTIADSLGRLQMANFVNEDGLYDVILDSRKPSARDFRKWVTSEVLPQIRKTGGYIPLSGDDDEKTILAKAVTILQRTLKQKDDLLEAQRPKVEFAEAVTTGDGCILMSEIAKLLTRYGVTKRYIVTCYMLHVTIRWFHMSRSRHSSGAHRLRRWPQGVSQQPIFHIQHGICPRQQKN